MSAETHLQQNARNALEPVMLRHIQDRNPDAFHGAKCYFRGPDHFENDVFDREVAKLLPNLHGFIGAHSGERGQPDLVRYIGTTILVTLAMERKRLGGAECTRSNQSLSALEELEDVCHNELIAVRQSLLTPENHFGLKSWLQGNRYWWYGQIEDNARDCHAPDVLRHVAYVTLLAMDPQFEFVKEQKV